MSETTRIDSVLLAKAKYDYDKDVEKLIKYDILPDNHNRDLFEEDTEQLPVDHVLQEITPLQISDAAEARAAEFGKDVKVYTRELEITLNKMIKHSPEEVLRGYYKKYENYDLASEAAQAENPFTAILGSSSAA